NPANPMARAAAEVAQLLGAYVEEAQACVDRASELYQQAQQAVSVGNHPEANRLQNERQQCQRDEQSFRRLERQLRSTHLISFLMSRGVLPSFAFPVNVGELHVLAQEMNPDRNPDSPSLLRFERDMKIALGEYAPDSRVVAGMRVYRAVGLRKFPALQFDG